MSLDEKEIRDALVRHNITRPWNVGNVKLGLVKGFGVPFKNEKTNNVGRSVRVIDWCTYLLSSPFRGVLFFMYYFFMTLFGQRPSCIIILFTIYVVYYVRKPEHKTIS